MELAQSHAYTAEHQQRSTSLLNGVTDNVLDGTPSYIINIGKHYMVKVYDNGGATFDRYTIVTKDALYTMSDRPSSPSGVNQFSHQLGDGEVYEPSNDEREVPLEMVPVVILIAIINRLEAE